MKIKLKDNEKYKRNFSGFWLLEPWKVYEVTTELWKMRFKKSVHVIIIDEKNKKKIPYKREK